MSDNNGQYRYGTKYSVEFPLLPSLTHPARKAYLQQTQGQHDILTLEFSVTSSLWAKLLATGVPVRFKWETGKYKGEWLGYVHSVKQNWAKATQNVMEVVCLGSTFPLKNSNSEVFKNVSIPQAVEKIAKKFGYKFVTKSHPLRFSTLTMVGDVSYWEWIQQLAVAIGYGVVVNGTELQFLPLDDLINRGSYSAPVLSAESKMLPTNVGFIDKKLDHIEIVSGDYLEGGFGQPRTNKLMGGVDALTGRVFSKKGVPSEVGRNVRNSVTDVIFDEVVASAVVDTPKMATELSKGAAQAARLTLPAKIRCQGDPRIKPFSPIYIEGSGEETDGFWVVTKAVHMFSLIGEYQMEVSALTDGKGPNKEAPFRKATGSAVGMIDLESALNKQNVQSNTLSGKTVLDVKVPIVKQTGQGFNKTPARWKAT
jgi:hypothetical protein